MNKTHIPFLHIQNTSFTMYTSEANKQGNKPESLLFYSRRKKAAQVRGSCSTNRATEAAQLAGFKSQLCEQKHLISP